MSKLNRLNAIAAGIVAGALGAGAAQADGNPFSATDLAGGFQLASSHEGACGGHGGAEKASEGKCGEGKCGEGKCGGEAAGDKAKEGKCGGAGKAPEGKCGGAGKASEGKCGEGKCGGSKE